MNGRQVFCILMTRKKEIDAFYTWPCEQFSECNREFGRLFSSFLAEFPCGDGTDSYILPTVHYRFHRIARYKLWLNRKPYDM